MNCPSCGHELADGATFCGQCGQNLTAAGGADPARIEVEAKRARTYLIEAVLVTLCCCQIAGIVAIVYAALANGQAKAGNIEQADRYATIARRWSIAGFAIGALIVAGYFLLMLLGVATSGLE